MPIVSSSPPVLLQFFLLCSDLIWQ